MFRFTIRDLLWLTVIVALGVAWWIDRQRLFQELTTLADGNKVTVEGLVIGVDKAHGLAQISVGSDDGLKVSEVVEVRRGEKRVGSLVIRWQSNDKALGGFDQRNELVQKGDVVRFKLDRADFDRKILQLPSSLLLDRKHP
jgi:hypothetical protein